MSTFVAMEEDDGKGFLVSFLTALQAAISVLLTIGYGVLATQIGLISESSAKNVSSMCVKLFLPALLLTNIGSQLNIESGPRYVPIIVWGLVYNFVSVGFGLLLRRFINMPNWVIPAFVFNNTTAFPLLLVQSLGTTSILSALLWGPDDTIQDAIERAVSYFLINSMISNSFTFGFGPLLMAPEQNKYDGDRPDTPTLRAYRAARNPDATPGEVQAAIDAERREEQEEIDADEETSLLPRAVNAAKTHTRHTTYKAGKRLWDPLPSWLQWFLFNAYTFISAPLVGAIIGVIIGIIPQLRTIFFAAPKDGGYFKAWLTVSVENVGQIFPTLQVVIVGIKLSRSLRNMKNHESSGLLPWGAAIFIFFMRFIFYPAISIGIIYAISAETEWIPDDPVLWFVMMIMHTGPPALELVAMADVNGAEEEEKLAMAKLTTVIYCLSWIMAFPVVGALKAAQAAIKG